MKVKERVFMDEPLQEALTLLKGLIARPSFSGQEQASADWLQAYFVERGIAVERVKNNLIARNKHFDPSRETILLNSHHDTVKPNQGYTRDPFAPLIEDGRLYGLGSNDAGASLVSLMLVFMELYDREGMERNIIFIASAEEEISGKEGVVLALSYAPAISFGIVGEPTSLDVAVAEKGLMVLDIEVKGRAGHAARDEGENAIYKAMDLLNWFRAYRFPVESTFLGPVKMTVTGIQAGEQHNVVPDSCRIMVDVRSTDQYPNDAILATIRQQFPEHIINPRSMRLQPSGIDPDHELLQVADALGLRQYGSPTLSDQALMPFPTVKLGPGDSARSHSADEYIGLDEIQEGMALYRRFVNKLITKS